MPTAAASPPPAPGEILAGAAYTLPELRRRLGLGKAALRQARRSGLKIRRVGIRSFVLGSDVLEWLQSQPVLGNGGP
jgi:hypothetical protein